MIDFVEIKDANRVTIGIIDTASSIIWHSVYYGVGDFEIYIEATPAIVELLQIGNYVTRQNNDEVGVIEKISIDYAAVTNSYMVTASGRFAKSLLGRRLIYQLSGHTNTATILSGNVEIAVRQVVKDNAISCSFDSTRNIPVLGLAALQGYTDIIVDQNGNPAQKQVSYKNLLSYTDEVLEEYKMSARVIFNESNKMLLYQVFKGADRSYDNTEGNEPLVFSVDYDNLNSSSYDYDDTSLINAVLVGGEGEGLERFYSLLKGSQSGLQLRELFVDASSINKTYKDENEQEQTYTDAEYEAMLNQQGKLSLHKATEDFNGQINTAFGMYILNQDYFLGDIITIQDNKINKFSDVRITETTEVQDENGYSVDVTFG